MKIKHLIQQQYQQLELETKSFKKYFSNELKKDGWKKDAIITTITQVAVMNWLQMIPPLISQFNETTIETNWYVMTGFSTIMSYPYAIFRDWRKSRTEEKNLEKKIDNYFLKLNKPLKDKLKKNNKNQKQKKFELKNKTTIGKFLYEGTPFGIFHATESLFIFGVLYGISNFDKLINNSLMFGGLGFFFGNIYGGVIDGSRHITRIPKNKSIIKEYELNTNNKQLIDKKIYTIKNNSINEYLNEDKNISKEKRKENTTNYFKLETKHQIKKDAILIAASIALLIGSYKVIKPKYSNSNNNNLIKIKTIPTIKNNSIKYQE